MKLRRRLRLSLVTLVALILSNKTLQSQEPVEEISGLVTDTAGTAIAGALMFVTRAPDRTTRLDSTDAKGHFEVVFDGRSGEYLVVAEVAGFRPFRQRIVGADAVVPRLLEPRN